MFDPLKEIILEAGSVAKEHFSRLSSIKVESKGHLDLVTQADKEVESLIVSRLRRVFPGDGVYGEEGAAYPSDTGRTWVIDPIDGTFNFLRGADRWAISIGLYEHRKPSLGMIYAPVRDQLIAGGGGARPMLNGNVLPARNGLDRSRAACAVGLHPSTPVDDQLSAIRFIVEDAGMTFRNSGCAVTDLVDVALGEIDGYVGMGISTWDLMGILPTLEQLGVTTTIDWAATELQTKLKFVCGTPEFLKVFADTSCPILRASP